VTPEEGGEITGTKDKDYNVIWFVEQCLSNTLRLETYVRDSEREGDRELAEFLRRAAPGRPSTSLASWTSLAPELERAITATLDGQRWEFRIDLTGSSVMASRVPMALPFEGPTLGRCPRRSGSSQPPLKAE
jgi:hypothetical protein